MSLHYQRFKFASVLCLTVLFAVAAFKQTTWAEDRSTGQGILVQEAKLTPDTTVPYGLSYGTSVALSADGLTAVVGASNDTGLVERSGAAYILHFDGTHWIEQAKLVAIDGQESDAFGSAVALSADGTIAFISAYFTDVLEPLDNIGAVYVFAYNGTAWVQRDKIVPSVPYDHEFFGYSLGLDDSGTHLIVGSPLANTASGLGKVEIFGYNGSTWINQAVLFYDTPQFEHSVFGTSVALDGSGTTAVIGIPDADTVYVDDGKVLIFRYQGGVWTQQAELLPTVPHAKDHFGSSVAVSQNGNRVVVGAPDNDDLGNKKGTGYIFDYTGSSWVQTTQLYGINPGVKPRFGKTVSISRDGATTLIGAIMDSESVSNEGSASVFKLVGGNWQAWNKLVAGDPVTFNYFGIALTLDADGTTALVGAIHARDANGNPTGAVYVFEDNGMAPTPTFTPEATEEPSATPTAPGTVIMPVTATPTDSTRPEPTETPTPVAELLENGSFETAADDLPTGWTGKNLSGDKQKCNKADKPPIAHDGLCVFTFKGAETENSKLLQTVNLAGLETGDVLILNGYVNAKGEVNAKVKVRVKYTDPTLAKGKITLKIPAATGDFVAFDTLSTDLSLILAGTPQNVKVQLQNRGGSGKVVFDAVSLSLASGSEISGRLIPVPQPQMRLDTRDS